MDAAKGSFTISTEKNLLDIGVIHGFLSQSYWAAEIPEDLLKKCIEQSLCFGVYRNKNQVGFARVITDRATFAYLADVFILEEFRGLGLPKWLMETIKNHPDLQNLRRWMLATLDAHGLYTQFEFVPVQHPERLMEIVDPEIYKRMKSSL